ncbi:carboxypeptidase-like regulatory domain-containing protein [Weeksellaceae bacterium TAE3-ERU29]|nr:carboxypeptidase-like regulatory domain-containing protein [Weeksellaceae bacterium TAE3-ERU29]
MKKYVFLLFLSVNGINVFAQQHITGKVINSSTQTPIEFVNVLLFQNDSIPVTGTITDELGNFNLSAEKGDYILKIEQFGETFLSKNISLLKIYI